MRMERGAVSLRIKREHGHAAWAWERSEARACMQPVRLDAAVGEEFPVIGSALGTYLQHAHTHVCRP